MTYKDTFIRVISVGSNRPLTNDISDLSLPNHCIITCLLTWIYYVSLFLCHVLSFDRGFYSVASSSSIMTYLLSQILFCHNFSSITISLLNPFLFICLCHTSFSFSSICSSFLPYVVASVANPFSSSTLTPFHT